MRGLISPVSTGVSGNVTVMTSIITCIQPASKLRTKGVVIAALVINVRPCLCKEIMSTGSGLNRRVAYGDILHDVTHLRRCAEQQFV